MATSGETGAFEVDGARPPSAPAVGLPRAARFDPIRAVEACYGEASSEAAWLALLVEAVHPLDLGLGVLGEAYHLEWARGHVLELRAASAAVPPGLLAALDGFRAELSPEAAKGLFHPAPRVGSLLERARGAGPALAEVLRELLARFGAGDALLVAAGAAERALVFAVPVPSGRSLPSARLRRQLEGFASHLASALRLREALLARDEGPSDAPRAKGRRADEKLALAVRRLERASGPARSLDPREALPLLRGLLEGHFTLVGHGVEDGRRFVLARRNTPGLKDPKALVPREKHVLAIAALGHQNKYIGHELGLAPSTVATHLESLRRKLGLSSRREIIETFSFVREFTHAF
ncbi:MAG TPA: helix-turn-helix transcriptional regulator [Anaeromyxobacteraceae bacterium]|nr:helix-turn-helix transcriptional regulator [Anaeromyxobacteraceae bacterium]